MQINVCKWFVLWYYIHIFVYILFVLYNLIFFSLYTYLQSCFSNADIFTSIQDTPLTLIYIVLPSQMLQNWTKIFSSLILHLYCNFCNFSLKSESITDGLFGSVKGDSYINTKLIGSGWEKYFQTVKYFMPNKRR